ncbi:MAG: tetratricopeptide repeat protein [Bacteroidales bacterium]|nr:tetratricopeptide repeat protein [Bacteroidales bacterium]MBN2763894.1 tetratricopeptide repeat protein [Bacteroidales bacterium]
MKKISFAIVLLMCINLLGKAQMDAAATQASLINYSTLENKLKKSNKDIENPKKNTKAKTWLDRGELMNEIYNVHIQYLRKGMSVAEAKIYFKEPKEVKTYEDAGNAMEDYVYERITITFKNGTLDSWKETNKIYENPLPEARKSFEEAIRLDTDGKEEKDIKEQLAVLKLAYETEAVFAYNLKDYKEAYNNFSQILEINKLPVFENIQDTIILYNTGRAAYEMKDYNEAIRLFKATKDLGYEESFLHIFLKNSYFAIGDTLAGVQELTEGFKKYPEDESILIELINYYLVTQQSEKALDFLGIARKDDPSNVSYIFAEGTIHDKMGDFEKAKKLYQECLEVDPEFYNAAYNLGVLHYNEAVKMYEDMINISDDKEYEESKTIADDMFKAAIPYMEKAHEIEPTSKEPLETLKTLYYRLQMNDKYEEVMNMLKFM